MTVELGYILEQIRREGIESAEQEKQKILQEAKKEAAAIIERAKAEVSQIRREVEIEMMRLREAGKAELQQAARNVVTSLEQSLVALLRQLIDQRISAAFDVPLMKELILKLADAYAQGKESKLEVILGPDMGKQLGESLLGELQKEFKKGVSLKISPKIGGGVRVVFDGTSLIHDLSSEAITEMLATYLTPRLLEVIRGTKTN